MFKPLLTANQETTNVLFPLRFQWAWDSYLTMMENHWSPLQIPMSQDIQQWARGDLSPAIRHLFEGVMAQLTTFDLQRGVDIAEVLMERVQVPELKQALIQQAAQEALHTWSYQTCIENLRMDQTKIYTLHKKEIALARRVQYANNWSTVMASLPGNPEAWTRVDHQNFIAGIYFWYCCFEGVWFVTNLACPIQALARRNYFQATAEQFQYILRDEDVHVAFGINLLHACATEFGTEVWNDDLRRMLYDISDSVIALEDDFADYLLPEPILGYNAAQHKKMARWYMNKRMIAAGLRPTWVIDSVPLPWVDELTGGINKEKNFFERHVQEYRTGGTLNWDDD